MSLMRCLMVCYTNVLQGRKHAWLTVSGMILFPLGEDIFEDTGPDGISMFYVSCIVSQLVYAFGGSRFKGGVGSEMVNCTFFERIFADHAQYRSRSFHSSTKWPT